MSAKASEAVLLRARELLAAAHDMRCFKSVAGEIRAYRTGLIDGDLAIQVIAAALELAQPAQGEAVDRIYALAEAWVESEGALVSTVDHCTDGDQILSAFIARKKARAAFRDVLYAAPPAQAAPVDAARLPNGWVAVPKVATPAMREAGRAAHYESEQQTHEQWDRFGLRANRANYVFDAMIAATPSPPSDAGVVS